MGSILYSNCSTITAGCFIYTNVFKTSPASNGYYSDGTNCYDVQFGNGYVQVVSSCSYAGDVYFTVGGPTTLDANGDYEYIIYASSTADSYGANPVIPTTTVTVFMDIVTTSGTYSNISGSLGSTVSCSGNNYIGDTAYANATVNSITLLSVSPTSNGGQTYLTSTGDMGPYTCP